MFKTKKRKVEDVINSLDGLSIKPTPFPPIAQFLVAIIYFIFVIYLMFDLKVVK